MSMSNKPIYRNSSAIDGVTYTSSCSALCNSITEVSTISKFTHARTTQCFLVPHCSYALYKSVIVRGIFSRCERRSYFAPSTVGPAKRES